MKLKGWSYISGPDSNLCVAVRRLVSSCRPLHTQRLRRITSHSVWFTAAASLTTCLTSFSLVHRVYFITLWTADNTGEKPTELIIYTIIQNNNVQIMKRGFTLKSNFYYMCVCVCLCLCVLVHCVFSLCCFHWSRYLISMFLSGHCSGS